VCIDPDVSLTATAARRDESNTWMQTISGVTMVRKQPVEVVLIKSRTSSFTMTSVGAGSPSHLARLIAYYPSHPGSPMTSLIEVSI
jgi:hypothetical protein